MAITAILYDDVRFLQQLWDGYALAAALEANAVNMGSPPILGKKRIPKLIEILNEHFLKNQ